MSADALRQMICATDASLEARYTEALAEDIQALTVDMNECLDFLLKWDPASAQANEVKCFAHLAIQSALFCSRSVVSGFGVAPAVHVRIMGESVGMMLALCSSKEYERYMDDVPYPSHKVMTRVSEGSTRRAIDRALGGELQNWDAFAKRIKWFDRYAHASSATLRMIFRSTPPVSLIVGPEWDEARLVDYSALIKICAMTCRVVRSFALKIERSVA